MTKKSKPKRKRVRLNGSKPDHRDAEHMRKMTDAAAKARNSSPRYGRGKGFTAHSYKYKELVSLHETSPYAHKRTSFDPESRAIEKRNVPMFIKKPLVADKMIEQLSKGIPPSTVCKYAGIHYETFLSWLKIGAKGENEIYVNFLQRVAQAEAKAEINLVEKMEVFQNEDWKSIAWMLERRWPERWARRDKLQVTNEAEAETKEQLASKVADNQEALDLARRLLEDGTEVYELPGDVLSDEELDG